MVTILRITDSKDEITLQKPSQPPTSSCPGSPHSTFINAPALLYGSGLGSNSIFPGAPACVPPAVSYAHYFGCYGNQTYELVATDYGHMDLLDDTLSGCYQHPLNCAAAGLCAGASAGFSRSLLRGYLGELVVAFLDSALKVGTCLCYTFYLFGLVLRSKAGFSRDLLRGYLGELVVAFLASSLKVGTCLCQISLLFQSVIEIESRV